MKLLFERSVEGRRCSLLPENKVPFSGLSSAMKREIPLRLPEMAEVDISRHYTALAKQVYGVNSGFYPLGSCTMKYNPAVNEELSSLLGLGEYILSSPNILCRALLKSLTHWPRTCRSLWGWTQ